MPPIHPSWGSVVSGFTAISALPPGTVLEFQYRNGCTTRYVIHHVENHQVLVTLFKGGSPPFPLNTDDFQYVIVSYPDAECSASSSIPVSKESITMRLLHIFAAQILPADPATGKAPEPHIIAAPAVRVITPTEGAREIVAQLRADLLRAHPDLDPTTLHIYASVTDVSDYTPC